MNDLDSDQSPDLTAKPIVDVASNIKSGKHGVTMLNIMTGNDRFMVYTNEVNKCLTESCFKRDFLLIDHSKTLKSQHFNGSKLHLNKSGTPILQNTFSKVLASIFSCKRTKLV